MTFSIVIPTYNGSRFVEQALKSALAQTRPADEIIVSDDNSSDNTLEICRKYSDRIKIYVNEDGPSGFVNGWNKAIAHATSDFVSILHQDDLLDPTFLDEAEKALAKHPNVKHFFVPCNYIDESGRIIKEPSVGTQEVRLFRGEEYIVAYRHEDNPKIHRCPGVITHKSVFEQCKYRTEAGHIADDDFFYRVAQYTDVLGLMKPLSSYRIHLASETGHLSESMLVRRLLHDMDFQYKNAKYNRMMPEEIKKEFLYWKRRYSLRLFRLGLKQRSLSNIKYSLSFLNLKESCDYMIRKIRLKALRILIGMRCSDLKNVEKALIVAPHPDDEVIGCGGLIARLCAEGRPPHVVILTGGEGSHHSCCNLSKDELVSARHRLTLDAAGILGLPEDHIHCLDFTDGHITDEANLDKLSTKKLGTGRGRPSSQSATAALDKLDKLITELAPATLFVPHWGEGWPDHVNAARMVRAMAPKDAAVYEYCVWMWYYNVWQLDWRNARQLKMSPDEHAKKLAAIDAYVSPCAPCGKPWSGVLPKLFLDANRWNRELYFKA